ncbi:alpha/beta fold hydrolase [Agreia bicolorata]|uniref:alpha/beta fold hydrolase n=1 Tax=Agreia bicolorata TaxID=110935 RepID=UPI003CC8128E
MNSLVPDAPRAQKIMSSDGLQLATYDFGDADAPTVLAVHGFASSALVNWHATGWTRDLTRAGYRVIALDQRGHGESDKPHAPSAYSMEQLVADLVVVMDTYLIDEAVYAGYSLGARVGWQAALDLPGRITRAVLGGIPDGQPLTRLRTNEARAFIETGAEVEDRITRAYVTMASAIPGNDLEALMSLVDGMRDGIQPDPSHPPLQPVLFATGSDDAILERSRSLSEATPNGVFYEIPGRNHFNAPTSRHFRTAAIEFLRARTDGI